MRRLRAAISSSLVDVEIERNLVMAGMAFGRASVESA